MSKCRDSNRLKAIRKLGCCVDNCGLEAVAAHSNFYIHGKGRGTKASDKYVIPLCLKHHYQFDTYDMGMNRNESLVWFNERLEYVNGVLDADNTSVL